MGPDGTIGACDANSAAGRSAAGRTPRSPDGSSATAAGRGCRAARPGWSPAAASVEGSAPEAGTPGSGRRWAAHRAA